MRVEDGSAETVKKKREAGEDGFGGAGGWAGGDGGFRRAARIPGIFQAGFGRPPAEFVAAQAILSEVGASQMQMPKAFFFQPAQSGPHHQVVAAPLGVAFIRSAKFINSLHAGRQKNRRGHRLVAC